MSYQNFHQGFLALILGCGFLKPCPTLGFWLRFQNGWPLKSCPPCACIMRTWQPSTRQRGGLKVKQPQLLSPIISIAKSTVWILSRIFF